MLPYHVRVCAFLLRAISALMSSQIFVYQYFNLRDAQTVMTESTGKSPKFRFSPFLFQDGIDPYWLKGGNSKARGQKRDISENTYNLQNLTLQELDIKRQDRDWQWVSTFYTRIV